MQSFYSAPTLSNCTFSGNMAFQGGGGMGILGGNPMVSDCIFTGNSVTLAGGGMYNSQGNATVSNCTFTGNQVFLGAGGGMFNSIFDYGSLTIINCTFSRNTADGGGGMLNEGGRPAVINCTFHQNTARNCGGMYNYAANPTVTNCTFIGNKATQRGGGMCNSFESPILNNCIFAGNTGDDGGGMYNFDSGPTVRNCILWGDSPEEIVNAFASELTISYSDAQGGLPVGAIDGGGNIDLDPMFVRPPDPGPDGMWDGVDDDYGDLRLQPGSPCINAGNPAFVPEAGETDLDDHARVLCERVDMGAYEFGIGDYDCNQIVNLDDFAAWEGCLTGPMPSDEATEPRSDEGKSTAHRAVAHDLGCEAFDFDADGDVDLADFQKYQQLLSTP